MEFTRINLFGVCVLSFMLFIPVHNAPRRRYNKDHSSTKFDQKQSGDYNVQVHLKDFHIVALLGDDSWGNLGDYDYNYDYSDLTIKPTITPSSSENPGSSSTSEATTITVETQKPLSSSAPSISSTPELQSASTTKSPVVDTSEQPLTSTESSEKPSSVSSTTAKVEKSTKPDNNPVTNISLIPVKIIGDYNSDHPVPLGEILHYRKCTDGFSKDAHGRCRKIVRKNSQIPFGITRLASSLASRIRQVASSRE